MIMFFISSYLSKENLQVYIKLELHPKTVSHYLQVQNHVQIKSLI
jgi:hypothetical protein